MQIKMDNFRHPKRNYHQRKVVRILQRNVGINQRIPQIEMNKNSKYGPRSAE
jgi:hypothetical protein